ncbi:MAG: SDR family oxidoreductase [Candidatus Peribacteraceae bacterium]|nr:SDR family oxidoreductase [Candidatus Peribacteraceae bacterium]MDD5742001.1 SDR family oxidoreductase [Candidatus Peribacteraceae bacterium]
MKALVIGASGLVGTHLMQAGRQRGWQMTGTFVGSPRADLILLDMGDATAIQKVVGSERPDVLFLAAFNPNVDECERKPQETRKTNVEGNTNVIAAANTADIPVIYYSSDYVFDGLNGPYRETDMPNPLNEYGRQKLAVEQLLAKESPRSVVIRTTVVYGQEELGKNFLYQVLRALREGTDLSVPTDQISTPTFAPDLAEASLDLAEKKVTGIFHVAGPDILSRFAFAEAIADAFGLPKNHLKPITTAALMQAAKRPLKAGLVCEKIRQTLSAWKRHSIADNLHTLRNSRGCWH